MILSKSLVKAICEGTGRASIYKLLSFKYYKLENGTSAMANPVEMMHLSRAAVVSARLAFY